MKHKKNPSLQNDLLDLGEVIARSKPGEAVNVTSHPFMFGDPFMGDPDDDDDLFEESLDETGDLDPYGDLDDDDYGDVDDPYGDVDLLGPYSLMSGDPIFTGGPRPVRTAIKKLPRGAKIAGGVALGAGAVVGAAKLRKMYLKKKLAKARRRKAGLTRRTLQSSYGRIAGSSAIKFIDSIGLKMNSGPIDLKSKFVVHDFKLILDQQQLSTPFYHETVAGAIAGPTTYVCTATGLATPRFYHTIFIQMGVNALNFVPASIVNVTGTLPTVAGNLIIAVDPINATFSKYGNAIVEIHPWQLVANKPLLVQGVYDLANNITMQVDGLPAGAPGQAAVTMIVPGSLHPWTIMIRNAALRGR